MFLIESPFNLGDTVYLKTDKEQDLRIVKQICVTSKGMEFNLVCGVTSSWHSEFEITTEIDVLKKFDAVKNDT